MPDECLNYERVMKYIFAGAGLMVVGYIVFKRNSSTASLNALTPKIDELEHEISSLKAQLQSANEQLKELTKSPSQSPVKLTTNGPRLQGMDSNEENKMRQAAFGMY